MLSPSRWTPPPPPPEMATTPAMHSPKPRKNRGRSFTFREKIHSHRAVKMGEVEPRMPVLEAVLLSRAMFCRM